MMNRITLEKIQAKIKAGKNLTKKEYFIWLTKLLGYSDMEAKTIIAISENKNPNILID
jgi:hypothetical protein